MNRREIYELLCEVIKEAELGKKECIRDDFEEWRLCDHTWENLQGLIDKIGKAITAKDRAMVEGSRIEPLPVDIDLAHGSFDHLPQSNDIRGVSGVDNAQLPIQDRPFPGIL